MAITCRVEGDDLIVTRDRKTSRLSLVVPIDRLGLWLDISSNQGFWEEHQAVRDTVMPEAAAECVREVEKVDAIDAVEITRKWSTALGGRLGKALSQPSSGESTEQPSHPTSGEDSESGSTE